MKNQILKLAVILIFLVPVKAIATPVTVGDNVWMQPLQTVNNSWNDISEVCNYLTGECVGILGTVNLAGWTWASADEVGALLAEFVPTFSGTGFLSEVDSDWAPDFFASSGFESTEPTNDNRRIVVGLSRSLDLDDPDFALTGSLIDTGPPESLDSVKVGCCLLKSATFSNTGGWFFRAADVAQVSEPGTLALLGLGLAGLAFGRRRRKC